MVDLTCIQYNTHCGMVSSHGVLRCALSAIISAIISANISAVMTYEGLEYVLESDDAARAAEFVDDNHHMQPLLTHQLKRLVIRLIFIN